jgi:hypothetical protein
MRITVAAAAAERLEAQTTEAVEALEAARTRCAALSDAVTAAEVKAEIESSSAAEANAGGAPGVRLFRLRQAVKRLETFEEVATARAAERREAARMADQAAQLHERAAELRHRADELRAESFTLRTALEAENGKRIALESEPPREAVMRQLGQSAEEAALSDARAEAEHAKCVVDHLESVVGKLTSALKTMRAQ